MTTSPSAAPVNGMQVYRRLLGYTRRYWVYFLIGTLGFMLNGLTEAASARLIQFIIDAIQNQNQAYMNWFPLLVVGVVF
ncbi:MAG: hypothetical protein Q8J78_16480, partial [Moraxellaceae bacterium]|nr:hypothetical protein [Moraxellaceae bacterium]